MRLEHYRGYLLRANRVGEATEYELLSSDGRFYYSRGYSITDIQTEDEAICRLQGRVDEMRDGHTRWPTNHTPNLQLAERPETAGPH